MTARREAIEREEGSWSRTLVIAEVAGCHDGDLRKALRLVRLASDVGADAAKFQWVSSPERLARRRRAPEYLAAYRTISFPLHWFPVLAEFCAHAGVEFMCTAYLPEDVEVVAEYVRRFKVSSFEALDAHFVCLHASYRKPLIISAGMGADLQRTLSQYRAAAVAAGRTCELEDVHVLHCVSGYPCPPDQLNLAHLWRGWSGAVAFSGLSDHSRGTTSGALAVAAGARIIEFHTRLADTQQGNADFAVARPPKEAREYVQNIRLAERVVGSAAALGPQPSEAEMVRYRVGGA